MNPNAISNRCEHALITPQLRVKMRRQAAAQYHHRDEQAGGQFLITSSVATYSTWFISHWDYGTACYALECFACLRHVQYRSSDLNHRSMQKRCWPYCTHPFFLLLSACSWPEALSQSGSPLFFRLHPVAYRRGLKKQTSYLKDPYSSPVRVRKAHSSDNLFDGNQLQFSFKRGLLASKQVTMLLN